MEKVILKLKDDRLVYPFAVIGAALIAFPATFTGIAPHLMGALLILYAVVNIALARRFPALGEQLLMEKANYGRALVFLVLGVVLLVKRHEAIGPLGSIWATLSIIEVIEQVNEMAHERRFPIPRVLLVLVTLVLGIMLLFDPVEHFTFHVRILGIEMILYVIERKYADYASKKATR